MTILRRIARVLPLSVALFLVATPGLAPQTAFAQAKPGSVDLILRQMDDASPKFHSAEADFRWDLYERVVKQTTTQTGTIFYQKDGTQVQMGAKIVQPALKFLEYKNGTLRVYEPAANHLTVVTTNRTNQSQAESFLTLGFGGSGKDLAKAWTISDLGSEQISDGDKMVTTAKLDLVSKDQGVRNMFTHIVIWVDPQRGISLKQQFFTPSEDQRTTYYTHIRYNQKVATAPYEIKPAKGVTIDQH
jgi:outer membrane lipoprotein-sorting protein